MQEEGIMPTHDTYALVKEAVCALLHHGAQLEAAPFQIFCAPGAFEVSTALPLALNIPAELLSARLNRRLDEQPQTVYGARLVERVAACDGRLCFSLTDAFFEAALRKINGELPLPSLPPSVQSRAEYALSRALMLARKGGSGCEREARNMVWSALGVAERRNDKKALKLRLTLAAEHALSFGAELPQKERMALYEKSGQAAACAARCIAPGIEALYAGA